MEHGDATGEENWALPYDLLFQSIAGHYKSGLKVVQRSGKSTRNTFSMPQQTVHMIMLVGNVALNCCFVRDVTCFHTIYAGFYCGV